MVLVWGRLCCVLRVLGLFVLRVACCMLRVACCVLRGFSVCVLCVLLCCLCVRVVCCLVAGLVNGTVWFYSFFYW